MINPVDHTVLDSDGIQNLITDWTYNVEQLLVTFQDPIASLNNWIMETKHYIEQESIQEYKLQHLEVISENFTTVLNSIDEYIERLDEQRKKEATLQPAIDEIRSVTSGNIVPKQIVDNLQQTFSQEFNLLDFTDDKLDFLDFLNVAFMAFEIEVQDEIAGPFKYTDKFHDAVKKLKIHTQEMNEKIKLELQEKIQTLLHSVERDFKNMMHVVEKQLHETLSHLKALEVADDYNNNLSETDSKIKQFESLRSELNVYHKKIKEHLFFSNEDNSYLNRLVASNVQISSDEKEMLESLFGKHGEETHIRLRLSDTDLEQEEVVRNRIIALHAKFRTLSEAGPPEFKDLYQHACKRLEMMMETVNEESDDK